MLARPVGHLPAQSEITVVLRGLLGRDVSLQQGEAPAPPDHVAVYVSSEDRPTNVVAVDLSLAATMSAGLALVPVGMAQEWIASGGIDADATENVFEVLNVLAAAHNNGQDHAKHVRIRELLVPGAPVDDAVAAGLAAPRLSRDFHVTVDGYPGGWMRVAAIAP